MFPNKILKIHFIKYKYTHDESVQLTTGVFLYYIHAQKVEKLIIVADFQCFANMHLSFFTPTLSASKPHVLINYHPFFIKRQIQSCMFRSFKSRNPEFSKNVQQKRFYSRSFLIQLKDNMSLSNIFLIFSSATVFCNYILVLLPYISFE